MSDVNVGISLTLNNTATRGLAKAQADAEKSATAGAERQRNSYQRLAQARETLGVRPERVIQREIQQTTAAYNRLKNSGTLSWREQAVAADKMKQKVTGLTNEMGKLTRAQKAMSALKFGAAGLAGVTAAGYAMKAPMQRAMAYDERLGLLSNTAFAERDAKGRKMGEAQITEAIQKAIATGMTRDNAMSTLEKLVADDQVGGVKGALELLPFIGKVSTGSGSSGEDVAAMMGGFLNSGYAKDVEGAKRLMGISSAAATAGAFEKNDMAKHLPSLLPMAKTAGLTGEDGFRRLMVLLQQARTTAGSSDEAATNVHALLKKLSSNDTALDFKKAGRGDLAKYLMTQRAKGVDPLTAWQNVIDQEIAKNPNLKPAIAKIQGAKTKEEQDAAVEALSGMAEGNAMGKFFQDMHAQGALFGLRNKDVEGKVNAALGQSGTILDTDYENMADRAGVKTRIATEQAEMASIRAMDKLSPAISTVAQGFSNFSQKFPMVTAAAVSTVPPLIALAGASGLASVAMGGGPIGKAGMLAGAANAVKGAGGALMATRGLSLGAGVASAGLGTAAAGVLGAGAAGYGVGTVANWGINKSVQALTGDKEASLGSWLYDVLHKDDGAALVDAIKPPEQKPVEVNTTMQIGLAPGLVMQNQTMQATGGNVQLNTGNIMTGAPG